MAAGFFHRLVNRVRTPRKNLSKT